MEVGQGELEAGDGTEEGLEERADGEAKGEAEEREEEDSWVPAPIQLSNFTFDIQLHPLIDLIASSDVSGRISLYPFTLSHFPPSSPSSLHLKFHITQDMCKM